MCERGASIGGPAIGSLSSVQSNDQETFLPSGAESVLAANAAKGFSKSNSLPAFIVFSTTSGKTTPAQLASWKAFTTTVPGATVDNKETPGTSLGTVGDFMIDQPVTFVPSADGEAALAIVPLDADKVNAPDVDEAAARQADWTGSGVRSRLSRRRSVTANAAT